MSLGEEECIFVVGLFVAHMPWKKAKKGGEKLVGVVVAFIVAIIADVDVVFLLPWVGDSNLKAQIAGHNFAARLAGNAREHVNTRIYKPDVCVCVCMCVIISFALKYTLVIGVLKDWKPSHFN